MIAAPVALLLMPLAAPIGMGGHSRPITTTSAVAQDRFDEGLAWLSGFNLDEAARAFRDATEADPTCAMCFAGVALAFSPNININVLPPDRARAAREASQQAATLSKGATAVEAAFIDALRVRHRSPSASRRKAQDQQYADAMRALHQRFPDDADVAGWYAEALLILRPWDQWTRDGKPQPGTEEAAAALQQVLKAQPRHPMANHLLIHVWEASPWPERADGAAATLRTLAPAVGHLTHMPSHIDVRRGRYADAIAVNDAAIAVDDAFIASHPDSTFYRSYVMHNRHMLAFAAMMSGRSALALSSVVEMEASVPAEWIQGSPESVDGFFALRFEVLVRFGRWDDILKSAEPAAGLRFSRAMYRYARAVALAAKHDVPAARAEQRLFQSARRRVPMEAVFGANKEHALLDVAAAMLQGEIALAEGALDGAAQHLTAAVAAEDALKYDEPPDWIQPARHALGAVLLKQAKPDAAEQVYRDDLLRWPDNVWSLWGITTLNAARGTPDDAAVERFQQAKANADVPLTTSCFCVPGL